MIRVLREGNPKSVNGRWVTEWIDNGEILLCISPTNPDHVVLATPDRGNPGLYYVSPSTSRSGIRLRIRTPIPLFDASHMGRLDAAKTAGGAPLHPTEELQNEHPTIDPACCGG